jgi:outer membrane protein OmpA-like peptidoglycan-associated protein
MRTIVTGIIVFVLWSALCTWYYLTHIKDLNVGEPVPTEQTANLEEPAAADTLSAAVEPETTIESPGSFRVHHEFNRSEVIPDMQFDSYIEMLSTYLQQMPGARLTVTGHTDGVGSEDYNQRLGMLRAEATKDYLERKGIAGPRISISSKGESAPVASNETDSGRAQNRRSEIQIIE